ncbi:unnamed protein product [Closterium sp. NIES-54]
MWDNFLRDALWGVGFLAVSALVALITFQEKLLYVPVVPGATREYPKRSHPTNSSSPSPLFLSLPPSPLSPHSPLSSPFSSLFPILLYLPHSPLSPTHSSLIPTLSSPTFSFAPLCPLFPPLLFPFSLLSPYFLSPPSSLRPSPHSPKLQICLPHCSPLIMHCA